MDKSKKDDLEERVLHGLFLFAFLKRIIGSVMATDERCEDCGGKLRHYDTVSRIVRTERGERQWIKVQRKYCVLCGRVRRYLPNYLLPYRHYRSNIIFGFLSGDLTSFNLDYEDYPCETTIKEWKRPLSSVSIIFFGSSKMDGEGGNSNKSLLKKET